MITPLVIDSDLAFLEKIKADPQYAINPPILALSGREALEKLADPNLHFSGIFISSKIKEPSAIGLIRTAHLKRLGTPLYLITDDLRNNPAEASTEKLAIQQTLTKPIQYTELVKLITPLLQNFDSAEALQIASRANITDERTTVGDERFIPVFARNFLSGSKSFFDLYIRLTSGRTIMIQRAGDTFEPDRLAAYLRKGIQQFYILKEAQEQYVKYCEHLSQELVKNSQVPTDMKVHQTLNAGHEMMSFLRRSGISEVNVGYTVRFVDNLRKTVKEMELHRNEIIAEFILDSQSYDHAISVAMLCSLLLKPLGFTSQKLQQLVGLTALFHDLGLGGDEETLAIENPVLYHNHPNQAAYILQNIGNIDPVVIESVRQHHERRTGEGFPRGIGAGDIHRVAEIVAICDEFALLVRKYNKDKTTNPYREMQDRVFQGFSVPVIQAFRTTFSAAFSRLG